MSAKQHRPVETFGQRRRRLAKERLTPLAELMKRRRRERLANRRAAETFALEVGGLRYTATVGRYADGRIAEIFLTNHKSNSAADVGARDAAIAFSFAVQHGADPEAIRLTLCRDSQGRASGALGAALDRVVGSGEPQR
jgi:hypothetical protein